MTITNIARRPVMAWWAAVVALALSAAMLPVLSTQSQAVTSNENGLIAFVSNRDGNSEIYSMDDEGCHQTNLTDNPAVDLQAAWSPDGTKIAFTSSRDDEFFWDIYVMNADGSDVTRLAATPRFEGMAQWSPDGSRIAFVSDRNGSGEAEIYVMNVDGSDVTQLTDTRRASVASPRWSPDGSRIAFASNRDGSSDVYVMNADGSGAVNLTRSPGHDGSPSWFPDGSRLAFYSDRDGDDEVYVMSADGSDQTRLTNNSATDRDTAVAPDGSKIAFTSDRDGGTFDIYVMNADGSSPRRLTDHSASHNTLPAWGTAPATHLGCDRDGDGVPDDEDAFPDDPTEWGDRDGDGVGDNADAFPDDPTEWADRDGDGLGDNGDPDTVADAVDALSDEAMKAPGHRSAIRAHLDNAEDAIVAGDTDEARRILENLRRHLDGCETLPAADMNDWIVDCAAQDAIRDLLDTLLATLP